MVMGIAMGVVLAWALWYLVSVGYAIVAQERLQDAADAMAFQSAVWHARGMNLIALLNMTMAAVLLVIIGFRLVELVVVLVLIVCHVALAITGVGEIGCGVLDVGTLATIVTWETRISKIVLEVMRGISWAQSGTAVAIPYFSRERGLEKTRDFYQSQGVFEESTVFSLSLLPTSIDWLLVGANSALEGVGAGKLAVVQPRIGWWGAPVAAAYGAGSAVSQGSLSPLTDSVTEGLPSLFLQRDVFGQICSRSGEIIGSTLVEFPDPLQQLGIPVIGPLTRALLPEKWSDPMDKGLQLLRTGVGDAFGTASSLLCKPLPDLVADSIKALASLPEWATEEALEWAPGAGNIMDIISNSPLVDALLVADADDIKPAKLWMFAHNGNALFRTWASVGQSAPSRWSFVRNMTVPPGQAVASAEYYSNCYELLPADTAIWGALLRDCEDDAMWRIGWTARMRRVRPVLDELYAEQIAGDILVEETAKLLPNWIGDMTPVASLTNWTFRNKVSPITEWLTRNAGRLGRASSDARDDIIH